MEVADELRERGLGSRRVWPVRTRGLLLVGQIAFSIALLIGTTLLMKSFVRLQSVDPGFQPANLLTAKIDLPPARYDTDRKKAAFFAEALDRVKAIPGIRAASMAMSLPTTPWLRTNIQIQGQPWEADPGNWPSVQIQSITPGYFQTLRIPRRRGRQFADRDNHMDAAPVVIINESFARRFWPMFPQGENPIGQHMREGADKTGWLEIVGIVGNVHEGGLAMDPEPEFYVLPVIHAPQTAYLVASTNSHPLRLMSAIRKELLEIDRDQPVSEIRTMEDLLGATLGQRRLTMWLLGSFAMIALLLAVVGMYGVIAYAVTQRTQEVGIRRALGAQRADILRLVVAEGLGLAIAGVAIGIAGTFALTRVMKSMLFQVSATDPGTFLGVAVLFLAIAFLACYIPARRAAEIDPMTALRIG